MKKEYSIPEMVVIMLTLYDSDIICSSVELDYGSGDNWTGDNVD